MISLFYIFILFIVCIDSYKILAIFPYDGASHHIYFSSIIEELASRKHDVTVVNYFHINNNSSNLKQIHLQDSIDDTKDEVNVDELIKLTPHYFRDFYSAYVISHIFKSMANYHCKKLMNNENVLNIIKSNEKYDLVILEQFVTDCGFVIAHKLKAPIVGMTAHVLMPWTYSRLGAPNNPAVTPNHFFGYGTQMNLWQKAKSGLINFYLNTFYKFSIQSSDQEIVKEILSDTPDLEELAKDMSLILVNQYFPLTGSRIYGSNVIEVGGLHVKRRELTDKALKEFLNNAQEGVVYISFGTVASNMPAQTINAIMNVIKKSKLKFLWKLDSTEGWNLPKNLFIQRWLPQIEILCHPNVVAFVSHSGMLGTSEAMHCGVPIISIPLFGDQFANAASLREIGFGVTLNIMDLTEQTLINALNEVLDTKFKKHAKDLSAQWNDRPMSAMDTAVYWIEFVAKHKSARTLLRPATVGLPLHQYLMLDVWFIALIPLLLIICTIKFINSTRAKDNIETQKKKKT